MKNSLFLGLFFSLSSFAQTPAPTSAPQKLDALCKDEQKIVQEYIDAELAGVRLQTNEAPPCIAKLKPETMTIDQSVRDDDSFAAPQYLLPKDQKMSFTIQKLPRARLDVKVKYSAKKNGKLEKVQDHFVLQVNSGKLRELRGCTSLYSELKYLVMSEACYVPKKKAP